MSKETSLYEISAAYEGLIDLCYDAEATESDIKAELEAIDGELTDKVANGINLILSLERELYAYSVEIDSLNRVARIVFERLQWIRNYYLENLARAGKTKVLTPHGVIKISYTDPPLIIDDKDSIPPEYKREVTKTFIDKDAVREALEHGIEVPGAHLEGNGKYLRISKGLI